MPPKDLWSATGAARQIAPLALRAHRVVESQETVATMSLVDNRDEQALLEDLLDTSKPPLPADLQGLHYLLAAPFRYPPLPHGSRFGGRHQRSLFYGAENVHTALGECAYYRLVFLAGLRTPFRDELVTLHTAFSVGCSTDTGLDLCGPAFVSAEPALRSPDDYTATQAFGTAMRAAGVELFRYRSARLAAADAINIGVFAPRALSKRIEDSAAWVCMSSPAQIRWVDTLNRQSLLFPRAAYETGGVLPQPAL